MEGGISVIVIYFSEPPFEAVQTTRQFGNSRPVTRLGWAGQTVKVGCGAVRRHGCQYRAFTQDHPNILPLYLQIIGIAATV